MILKEQVQQRATKTLEDERQRRRDIVHNADSVEDYVRVHNEVAESNKAMGEERWQDGGKAVNEGRGKEALRKS